MEKDELFRDETGGEKEFFDNDIITVTRKVKQRKKTKRTRKKVIKDKPGKVGFVAVSKGKERVVYASDKRFKKKYGKLPGKTKEGYDRYGRKVAVETSKGKVMKRAVSNLDEYFRQEYKKGKPYTKVKGREKEIIDVLTPRGIIKETKLTAKEKYTVVDKKTGFMERTKRIGFVKGSPTRDKVLSRGQQVKVVIAIETVDGIKRFEGYSKVQGYKGTYSKNDMEQQAFNMAKANACSELVISSKELPITDVRMEYGTYM